MSLARFADKVVLVTGAGSGIGRAAAVRIAAEGGQVFCCDLNEDTVRDLVTEIEAAGGTAASHGFDISKEPSVQSCVKACVAQFGKLDVLVNMAGIIRMDLVHELALADWQRIIDVNLTGTFLICKACIPHLLETKGNIVNAASTSSLQGLPWGAAYGASKGGVLSLTRTIAVEYAKQGLRANAVAPGDIKTNMTGGLQIPEKADWDLMGRISSLSGPREPEVVAGVIAMLGSDDGCHINGEVVRVDGGTLA